MRAVFYVEFVFVMEGLKLSDFAKFKLVSWVDYLYFKLFWTNSKNKYACNYRSFVSPLCSNGAKTCLDADWKDNSFCVNWLSGQLRCWQKNASLNCEETNFKFLWWVYFDYNHFFCFNLVWNKRMSKEKRKLEKTGYIQHLSPRKKHHFEIPNFNFPWRTLDQSQHLLLDLVRQTIRKLKTIH